VAAQPTRLLEKDRISRNLRVVIRAALAGAGLAIVSNSLVREWPAVALLALGAALLLLADVLRARGWGGAASILLLLTMVGGTHGLAFAGYGVHDISIAIYPVAVVIAALLLDTRLLVATTGLCILSVGTLVILERSGAQRRPLPVVVDWQDFTDVSVVLIVTAVALHLLVRDLARSYQGVRRREKELRDANRELEARNTELERFTYAVSHDLKTPLVTIGGFLGQLEGHASRGEIGRLSADVGRIRAASERMGRLLDELLELSRVGRVVAPATLVPFRALVEEARALLDGRLSARGARVELDLGPGPGPLVYGDRGRLVQLLQNLLDNACKFVAEGRSPRIVVGVRDAAAEPGGRLYFVRDNGIGIDPAHHDRVFGLFEKLDASAEGTGLGLALARRIVEAHGGRVWVESPGPGQGSSFCFTLAPGPA
jgi:signal transduction histidine kinase